MDIAKKAAAEKAIDYVKSGFKLGLGTGSTVSYFLDALAEVPNLDITTVASSEATENKARKLGIPVIEQWEGQLDLVVDGADAVDFQKRLIKGGGGALLREKMIAFHACKMIVIINEEKYVSNLGKSKIPVEVIPFGFLATLLAIKSPVIEAELRMISDKPFVTDNGNYIIDLYLKSSLVDLTRLDDRLHAIPGVVETGIFINLASEIIIGHSDGSVNIVS